MPLVNVKLAEGVYTEKQKHDMAARLTDAMVAFDGSEGFREVAWVLIEELHRGGWHSGWQPFFGPPTLMSALARSKPRTRPSTAPTTREDLATQALVRPR